MWLDLGNDEVYYVNYALYPDISHFDHPPFIGWLIQLTTLNLLFDNELFIRLSSVLLLSVNTFIIYKIVLLFRDERTALLTSLLYNTSLYGFVITGIFILPDTPLMFFWLLTLYLYVKIIKETNEKKVNKYLILSSISIGFGFLSKYTALFLLVGFLLYLLLYKRELYRRVLLYLSLLIFIMFTLPVLIWNMNNDFISFNFHGSRVLLSGMSINIESLMKEIMGQLLYNNPFNVFLIAVSIYYFLINKRESIFYFVLFVAIPMIIVFSTISLFRSTLPHWTGPAYTTLLIIVNSDYSNIRRIAIFSVIFMIISVFAGFFQIKTGLLIDIEKFNLDKELYGWHQLSKKFSERRQYYNDNYQMSGADIISNNWFPASHIDFYVARPNKMDLLVSGGINNAHKYAWINSKRRRPVCGSNYYYISPSYDFKDPKIIYKDYFREIIPIDTILIHRLNSVSHKFYVYKLGGCYGKDDLIMSI